MNLLLHPGLRNPLRDAMDRASAADSATQAAIEPFIKCLIEHPSATEALYQSLGQCLDFKMNADTGLGLAMLPGPDDCVGAIVVLGDKGVDRCIATNTMPRPTATKESFPAKVLEKFDALKFDTARTKLIHQAICTAASAGHMEWADSVASEAQRYRTAPVFVVAVTPDQHYFHAFVGRLESPHRSNPKLAYVGSTRAGKRRLP